MHLAGLELVDLWFTVARSPQHLRGQSHFVSWLRRADDAVAVLVRVCVNYFLRLLQVVHTRHILSAWLLGHAYRRTRALALERCFHWHIVWCSNVVVLIHQLSKPLILFLVLHVRHCLAQALQGRLILSQILRQVRPRLDYDFTLFHETVASLQAITLKSTQQARDELLVRVLPLARLRQ